MLCSLLQSEGSGAGGAYNEKLIWRRLMAREQPITICLVSGTDPEAASVDTRCRKAAASDPIVDICRPACERPLRRVPDVPIALLELSSRADASNEASAL